MSAADLIAVLLDGHLRLDLATPTIRATTPAGPSATTVLRRWRSRIATGDFPDDMALVASGLTVDEAVKAAERLEGDGIAACAGRRARRA
jgi:hypothetical protein